jgi:Fanconi anemia group M protein
MTFENIFSQTITPSDLPICPNPKIPIIVDTREKQSMIASFLLNRKANISFEKLDIGDYLIDETAIERKTYSDLVSSLVDKRLTEQLINLKKYPKSFLLVEGFDYDYKKFKLHENAIKGLFLSIALDFQIPVVFTKNEEDTANFLILAARKFESPPKEYSLRQSKSMLTLPEKKQFVLEGFPGIGPKKAKLLLERFGTIKNIVDASEEDLVKILGKKYEDFKKILDD